MRYIAYPKNLIMRFVDNPGPPFNDAASDIDVRIETIFFKKMECKREPLKRII